jgi:protein-S-isoprenylcysteine O-methyltransferase Ste14
MIDDPYRIVTLVLALVTLAVRAFFRWRAGTHREPVMSDREGTMRGLARTVLATASRLLVVLWALFPGLLSFADVPLPDHVRVGGAVVATLGVALLTWVHVALGHAFSATLVVRQGTALVTAGPYARVRHPMYAAFFLIVIGLAVVTANVLVGVLGLIAVAFVMIVRTPREERMLLDAHGDAWRAYASRTGRFLPRFGA